MSTVPRVWEPYWSRVGGLAQPAKMPAYAYGISADQCAVGGMLARVPGSICGKCYAKKGHYRYRSVETTHRRRFKAMRGPGWARDMSELLRLVYAGVRTSKRFFRWFDSGDIPDEGSACHIFAVAVENPWIRFWLPTRELALVRSAIDRAGSVPENLTIRVPAPMIDQQVRRKNPLVSSSVHQNRKAFGYECRAYRRSEANCGPCRACWNRDVANVSYPLH